jgi:uncharacterized protein Yka (UPF0111/DUF47 family)
VQELQIKLELTEEDLQSVSQLLSHVESEKNKDVAKYSSEIHKLEGDQDQVTQKLK